MKNDLYSRLYIDAHLCRPECGDLGQINSQTGKGIVYLAAFRGPWIAAIFLQSKGYEIITDETCNQCGDKVQIIRNLSELEEGNVKIVTIIFILKLLIGLLTHSQS